MPNQTGLGHMKSPASSGRAGLLFLSETDAPFEAFEWPGEEGKPAKARVLALVGLPPGTPVKVKGLDAFFKDAAAEHDWQNDREKAEAKQLRELVKVLKGL